MLRKGISGEYKDLFDERMALLSHQHMGRELITLGYEADAAWVKEFQPQPPRNQGTMLGRLLHSSFHEIRKRLMIDKK